MSRIALTPMLQDEYRHLFASCELRSEYAAALDALASAVWLDRDRYQAVGAPLGIPWFVVAAWHYGESGRDFGVHPHNGDPLTERTRHLPDGRPPTGEPPFRWEESATDALCLRHVHQWSDWSVAGVLFTLESQGGWRYRLRQPPVHSPYLWHGSTHYQHGKYVTDDLWNDTAIPQRYGVAVLLRRLAERDLIAFPGEHDSACWPLIGYLKGESSPWVTALQRFLNTLPGIYVKVDGQAGPQTSAAFHKLVGRRLPGDPQDRDPA